MDPETGLIYSPSHFTWMDTNFPAGTPREGYPIEIQALWYHALSFLEQIDPGCRRGPWHVLGAKVRESIQERFFLPEEGFLSDCLHTRGYQRAGDAEPDDHLRPNQLFALTLGAVNAPGMCRRIVAACETLLVPGGLRSLADRAVHYPLPILHQDRLLNDPGHPYQGVYSGDEDTRRKPAYHNGTAWAWLLPSFCEAWALTFGAAARSTARAFLGSTARVLSGGCAGQISEILDGDFPHHPRGCDAQAWSVSELLRVWLALR